MINTIHGSDVFAPKYSNYALAHQVNCQGRMGSGVAKTVREKYPEVYNEYHRLCDSTEPSKLLGDHQIVKTPHRQAPVINLFGQMNFGYDGQTYTDYHSFTESLTNACKELKITYNLNKVVMPYKIGCCRGGGDWDIVLRILKAVSDKLDMEFLLVSNT